jgi:methylmalonyl-CoA mutase N-terminal domain/subunit
MSSVLRVTRSYRKCVSRDKERALGLVRGTVQADILKEDQAQIHVSFQLNFL